MKYELIIIGSGPAGYVSAIRAGQLGIKTAIIEKSDIGGVCLNKGCIPSKSIMESAKLYQRILKDASKFGVDGIDKKAISFNYKKATQRANSIVRRLTKGVEFLLTKNKVEIINGEAEIIDRNTVSVNNRTLECDNIIIATGAKYLPVEGITDNLVNIDTFFKDKELTDEIVVFGSAPPAVEIAQMFALMDKKVTILITGDKIMPLSDDYMRDYMTKILVRNNINIISNVAAESIVNKDGAIYVGDEKVATGLFYNLHKREAVVPLSKVNIEVENGFIKTNDQLETSTEGIYAIGDVNGKSRFAHIASAEGLFVVNSLNGIKGELEFEKYPLNMYTVPECAQIGKTEQQLIADAVDYKVGEFQLTANGKALAEGANEGFVRILSDKKYGEVLGVQIVADHATDLISEASAFMQLESTVYDIAQTVHAHPTISEAFTEAGMEGLDGAIHK